MSILPRRAHIMALSVCGVFLGSSARLCLAQENSPQAIQSMTLPEAFAYAREHHPQIKSALATAMARKAEARIPRAEWLPQIGGTAQIFYGSVNTTTAEYLSVPEADLPRVGSTRGTGSTDWTPQASTIAGVSLGQEVFDFGRIAAQISVADAFSEMARADAASIDLDVQLGVEEAYHSVLAAKEVLHATEEAYKRATTHRDFAQAGVKSGMRPPIDLTRAQADVAMLGVRLIRATSGVGVAQAALAAAVGSQAMTIDAQPISLDESPAPAFDEAIRTAARANPAIAASIARLRAQVFSSKEIIRELLPNISASAGLNGRAGGATPSTTGPGTLPYGDGWLPDVANWHLGLVLQWNIFDGTVLARRAASKAHEQALQADLELERMSVTFGAEHAWLDLDTALKSLQGLVQSVDAAKANQQQADARFRAGLGTIIELADAEAVLTTAELELAIGQFSVARARATLGRIMGQPLMRKGT